MNVQVVTRRHALRSACAATSVRAVSAAALRPPVIERAERRILFAGGVGSPQAAPLSALPALHSRASATQKLFLDFNGDGARNWLSLQVPVTGAYDTDGNATTFSNSELADIQEIWARVAEKYSPFNLDVTTVDPGNRTNKRTFQIVIGGDGEWYTEQTGGQAGGVAPLGGFASGPATGYVFSDAFFTNKSIAEATAHEAGHGFGLEHQSTFMPDGVTKDQEYNPGDANVAPIMGVSYNATRGLWYRDKNSNNVTQDDLFVLTNSTNGFGYRSDDWQQSFLALSEIPRTDNVASVSGVIEKTTDVDGWRFSVAAGNVSFTVNPVLGGMLDATLTLRDTAGTIIAEQDTASLGETLTVTVPAGTYSISVGSAGNYGDIGQYTLNGTLPAGLSGGDGPLLILGTDFGDVISVTKNGDEYVIDVNGDITTHDVSGVPGFNIFSGDGHDRVTLGLGVVASYIDSGSGNDTVFAGEFDDSISAGAGNDLIYCGAGDDRVNGGNHSDYILGGDGRDRLYGNSGNDVLEGGAGGDRLYGGNDHDILSGQSSSDKMFGEGGNDTMYGGRGGDYMNGDIGLDVLYGQEGDDFLYTADDFTYDYLDGGFGTDHGQDGDTLDVRLDVEDLLA